MIFSTKHLAIISYIASGIACGVFLVFVIARERLYLQIEYVDMLGNVYFGLALIGLMFGFVHSIQTCRLKRIAIFRTGPVLVALLTLALSLFVTAS